MSQQANPSPLAVERSQAAVALDNLIRRHLRVSDPRDPQAISTALRERYVDEQQALDQEAAGLPFFKVTRIDSRAPAASSAATELQQSRADVSRDLDALLGNALLKDVHPELRGWSQHLRQAVEDGVDAARFALDPWQRDQAMGARRLLGDYARVARFVGALTPGMNPQYRSLAQSLDQVASVILVTIGEAIAQAGYGGGRFLLQAPASELQARRDGVINALRNLVGSRYAVLGQAEWAYGQHALGQVMRYLDGSGLTDLRALFQENHVARVLDELIHWATRGSAEDLRALGATAHLTLGRFRRLLLVTRRVPTPESPPFATYLDAIQLLIDAFSSGAGYRLLYIARPAIAHQGLYGAGGPDPASERMLVITALRGRLARSLDCYLGCDCEPEAVRCQVLLDKVLYDTDRAIDLYVMGTDFEGEGVAEQRAAAYGVVIDRLLADHFQGITSSCGLVDAQLSGVLGQLRDALWWGQPSLDAFAPIGEALALMHQELCIQRDAEAQWENLLHTLAPACFSWGTSPSNCTVEPANAAKPGGANARGILIPTQDLVESAICQVADAMGIGEEPSDCGTLEVGIPATVATGTEMLSGTRDIDGTHTGAPWSPHFREYLTERTGRHEYVEPLFRVRPREDAVSMNVVLVRAQQEAREDLVKVLRDLRVSEEAATAAVRGESVTILEGLSKAEAEAAVQCLVKVKGTEAHVSQRLVRTQGTACFDFVVEQPPDVSPPVPAQAKPETPAKKAK